MSLDDDAVMAQALAWVYVPPGAREVRTPAYHVVAGPPTWSNPTGAYRLDGDGPADAFVDEVLAAAASLDRHDVTFWTHAGTRPAGLVDELLARGAVLDEELAVLARPLRDVADRPDLPDLAVPDDVEVQAVTDLAGARAADEVGAAVFGGRPSSDEDLQGALRAVDTGGGRSWVARRDGVPVGSAGATIRGEVLRLWGGGVLEEARGTGVYRALLDHRLRVGVAAGCTTALVTGRLATSAPVLLRAGFTAHGEQRFYRLRAG